MASVNRYVAYTPAPSQTISNDQAPSGWELVSARTTPNVPREDISVLSGVLRAVGLVSITYAIEYFTMDADDTLTTEYCAETPALQLSYFGKFVDNVYLVGGQLSVAPAAGGHGICAARFVQNILSLGQRVMYA